MPRKLWIAALSAVLSIVLMTDSAFGFFGLLCHKKAAAVAATADTCAAPTCGTQYASCPNGTCYAPATYAGCYGAAPASYAPAYQPAPAYNYAPQTSTGCYGAAPTYQNCAPTYQNYAPTYQNCAPTYQNCAPTYQNCAPTYSGCGSTYRGYAPAYSGCGCYGSAPAYRTCR